MPADPTRYAVDGSTPGSELAAAAQHLTSPDRARMAGVAEDVHERVVALTPAATRALLDRLETDR